MSTFWVIQNYDDNKDLPNLLPEPSSNSTIHKISMNTMECLLPSHCATSSNTSSPNFSPSSEVSLSPDIHSSKITIRKIRNVRKSEKHHCSVCGDRPTGYHYDVLSCNGCKTFFRRTIINNRKFVCTKGGSCQFTKDFRCACRACRFNKCVRVGMNPAGIQFPSKNGADEEDNDDDDEPPKPSVSLVVFQSSNLRETTINTYRWVDDIFRREDAVFKHRHPGKLPIDKNLSLSDLLSQNILIGGNSDCRKPGILYHNDPVRYWMVCDLMLGVEFAKTFEPFQRLSDYDKKCLISQVGGVLHVATQSFYSFYEAKSTSLTFPDGINAFDRKMNDMKKDTKRLFRTVFVNYYSEMYNQPVHEFLKNKISRAEYFFIKSISLFSPDNTDMSENGRIIVNTERGRLANLFRKYLIAEYGFKIGISRFSTSLIIITTLIKYGEKRREYISLLRLMQFDVAKLGQDIYLNKPSEML